MNDTASVLEGSCSKIAHRTAYTTHAPVIITSNADFELQGWPGNGSETDPYRMQNLNITTEMVACIWIRNTTSHFIIEDCFFVSEVYNYTSPYPSPIFPVTLSNVSNGRVELNNFTNCLAAVSGYQLTNCSISNNNLNVSLVGILANSCNATVISGNKQGIESCAYGVSLHSCRNCTIADNQFANITGVGISGILLHDVHFRENTLNASTGEFSLTWEGIEVYGEFCSVQKNVIDGFGYAGVRVEGNNCTISRNNITASDNGIILFTNNSTVFENRISGSYNAIEMAQTNNTEVHHNTIYGRNRFSDSGISIYGGFDSAVHSNDITYVGGGIILQGATRYSVSTNNVTDGRYGFAMAWWANWGLPEMPFSDCDIINNRFDGGGLYPMIEFIEEWDFSTIRFEDNTVNGESIGFFANENGGTIIGDDYGQLLLVDCQDVNISGGSFHSISSTIMDPYPDPGIASALTLLGCTSCLITDCSFHVNSIGITMWDCINCELTEITGVLNSQAGVEIHDSEEITISNSSITGNTRGISLSWSFDCRIIECEIEDNGEGIHLQAAMNCLIADNSITGNEDALFLVDSDGSEMWNNQITQNGRGILLNSTSDCLITRNMVANNTGVGICLDATANRNTIFNNTFAYNTPNAICEGSSNHWDNQIDLGNYWSDFAGNGSYIIDENDQDNFPRTYPYIPATTTTTGISWPFDPLVLGAAGGVIGLVAIFYILYDRRRIRIVE